MDYADVIDAGRFRTGVAVVLAIALFGCGSPRTVTSEAAQAPLSVDVQLDPIPAHVGPERITVTVRDRNNAPVAGAVVIISSNYATVPGGHTMAMPGMGRVAKPVRAADAGDGVYHADIQLTKATHWTFVVDIAAAQTRTHVTRDLDVR
jgi:hypothetical protein